MLVTGYSPLVQAYLNGHIDAFKFLLEKGARNHICPHLDRNNNFMTIFTHAASKCNFEILRIMLDYGIDINEKSERGSTTLSLIMRDVEENWRQIADFLVDNGADIHCQDNFNRNLCDVVFFHISQCIDYTQKQKIEYLIQKGVKQFGTDSNGDNQIMSYLKMFSNTSSPVDEMEMRCILDIISPRIKITEKKFDINYKNKDGDTALSIARKRYKHDSRLVQFLLSMGAR